MAESETNVNLLLELIFFGVSIEQIIFVLPIDMYLKPTFLKSVNRWNLLNEIR